mmetsp:Transcript_51963/g.110410  ORF Transcript_51963/g.110410 Transcript_51963/m.110410 type:complete len:151 (-) Transcript_51963:1542-1994(-)
MQRRFLYLALILNVDQCHALVAQPTHHTKIVSRKSDGRYETFSLGDLDENFDGGPDGRLGLSGATQNFLHPAATLRRIQSAIRATFLPANRLSTLRSSGYLSYILYDNIQDLSTSLRSVLATKRILEGVGVGRAGATALSATLVSRLISP